MGNQVGDHESTKKGFSLVSVIYFILKNNWKEEQFEAQMRISRCLMRLPNHHENER